MKSLWTYAATLVFFLPTVATAGGTIEIGENKSVTLGGGLRSSLSFVEDGAPNGDDTSNDAQIENARIYITGKIATGLFAELNTEITSDGDVRLLDGVVKLEYSQVFKVWAGRFLPPSDRANLDGPYYLLLWDFPFVSAFPAIFAGRDNGLAIWGEVGEGFKYQVGVFEGQTPGANPRDNFLYAGRLVYNFLDPEPGYYNSSSYYGDKKVFAIALTLQSQSDYTVGRSFTGTEADLFFEYPTTGGVVTLEGALYDFDFDNPALAGQGEAFYVQGGFLFPKRVGPGQFQPAVRFQDFDRDTGADVDRVDIGVHYIIDGHNARLHANFGRTDDGAKSQNEVRIGFQLQF